jgi:predicted DNA-binding protein
MESKKLIPYSVYLPPEYYERIKQAAKNRQASSMVRDAIVMMLDGGDVYKSGYNKAIRDAAKVIYDCKEAQMVAVRGRDLGALLTEQINELTEK